MTKLIGTGTNQVPSNADLGTMAYQDKDNHHTITADGEWVGGGYMTNEQGRAVHVANTMPSPYYHFDGVNDIVDCGDIPEFDGATEFSASAWFRQEKAGVNTHTVLISKDNQFECWVDWGGTNTYTFSINNDHQNFASTDVPMGSWTHVVWTWKSDGDVRTVYQNGVLVQTVSGGSEDGIAINTGSSSLALGGRTNNYEMSGSISDVNLYNIALTADEVKELYSGASVPFKYKGASQTAINTTTVENGTAGGTREFESFTATSATAGTGTDTADPGHMFFPVTLEVGKKYRVTFDVTDSNGEVNMFGFSSSKNWYGSGGTGWQGGDAYIDYCIDGSYGGGGEAWTKSGTTHTGEILCTTAASYVGLNCTYSTGTMSCAVTNMNVVPIGAVAEYDGSSATSSTWYDKSGNGLDGTVIGATLENKGEMGGGAVQFSVDGRKYNSIGGSVWTTQGYTNMNININNCFDSSSDKFIAPSSGYYLFNASASVYRNNNDIRETALKIVNDSGDWSSFSGWTSDYGSTYRHMTVKDQYIGYLNAGDGVYVQVMTYPGTASFHSTNGNSFSCIKLVG